MKRKKTTLKNGFAADPIFMLEIRDSDGKLADIPFATEPIASTIKRMERAGAIAILITMLLQRPRTPENFNRLAAAVGEDSADAVRRLGIGADTEHKDFHCRLLDSTGRCIQVQHTKKPDYAVKSGTMVGVDAIADLAKAIE